MTATRELTGAFAVRRCTPADGIWVWSETKRPDSPAYAQGRVIAAVERAVKDVDALRPALPKINGATAVYPPVGGPGLLFDAVFAVPRGATPEPRLAAAFSQLGRFAAQLHLCDRPLGLETRHAPPWLMADPTRGERIAAVRDMLLRAAGHRSGAGRGAVGDRLLHGRLSIGQVSWPDPDGPGSVLGWREVCIGPVERDLAQPLAELAEILSALEVPDAVASQLAAALGSAYLDEAGEALAVGADALRAHAVIAIAEHLALQLVIAGTRQGVVLEQLRRATGMLEPILEASLKPGRVMT